VISDDELQLLDDVAAKFWHWRFSTDLHAAVRFLSYFDPLTLRSALQHRQRGTEVQLPRPATAQCPIRMRAAAARTL
jgi:hypothetical protein